VLQLFHSFGGFQLCFVLLLQLLLQRVFLRLDLLHIGGQFRPLPFGIFCACPVLLLQCFKRRLGFLGAIQFAFALLELDAGALYVFFCVIQ